MNFDINVQDICAKSTTTFGALAVLRMIRLAGCAEFSLVVAV